MCIYERVLIFIFYVKEEIYAKFQFNEKAGDFFYFYTKKNLGNKLKWLV